MESTVKERVKFFCQSVNISVREFEKRCDVSNGYFNNLKNGGIAYNKMLNIISKFPELNGDWLATGEGEMLRSEGSNQEHKKPVEPPASDRDNVQSLLSSNRELVQQHGELIAQHSELIRQQGELIEMIKVLVGGELSVAEPKKSRV